MHVTLANHAHVFPEEIRPEGSIRTLLDLMEQCEIEKTVAFAPFPAQVPGQDPNSWLSKALEGREELIGFGVIDFSRANLADQVKQAKDYGFLGLKLHPAYQGFELLGQSARIVYKWAEELGLFLSFHTGVHHAPLKQARLIDFDEIAYDYPNLKFSMEHVGGYHFFPEALAVICNHNHQDHCNIYAGMTSVFNKTTHPMWYLDPCRIEEIVLQTGEDRLVFGLDFPYNQTPEIKEALRIIADLPLTDTAKEKLLGGNLKAVLGLS